MAGDDHRRHGEDPGPAGRQHRLIGRERVLGRGVRADEHAPGHGLGLAMVSDTVAQYGGELSISAAEALGGARLDLRLPGRLGGPAAVVA